MKRTGLLIAAMIWLIGSVTLLYWFEESNTLCRFVEHVRDGWCVRTDFIERWALVVIPLIWAALVVGAWLWSRKLVIVAIRSRRLTVAWSTN
jgi:hypothetical protein